MRKGDDWGAPVDVTVADAAVTVSGDDAALAAAAVAHPGALFAFRPSPESDLRRALGFTAPPAARVVLPCDALRLGDGTIAANAVLLGVPPDRLRRWHRVSLVLVEVDGRPLTADGMPATTVVVATGQYVRGADVAPRGHPGDGRCEVQVYGLQPGERAAMHGRLATGAHVPHPRIRERSGRTVTVRWIGGRAARRGAPIEVDGHAHGHARAVRCDVLPGAIRVLG